jgi:hypothetical protein
MIKFFFLLITVFWVFSSIHSKCIVGDCENGYGEWEAIPYDGYKYSGEWKDRNKHGKGTLIYSTDGSRYIGEWENGNRHGKGTYTSSEAKYIGEWKNDSRYGKGILIYKSGTKYVGDFKNDDYDGYGILYAPNGSIKQKGRWKKGKFLGK